MNVIILGAGRMGQRHAKGVVVIDQVKKVCLVDIFDASLQNAKTALETLPNSDKFEYQLKDDFNVNGDNYDVAILATTAAGRSEAYEWVVNLKVKTILVEKPLGQSYQEVKDLVHQAAEYSDVNTYVNLNMRMYEGFKKLKHDLKTFSQFQGPKVITVNTGSLGIGANGIHYLDLLYFILDADRAELIAGEIDQTLIPSGRGEQFADFGGWCTIKFYDKENSYLGRAQISMSSQSTVFGGWDIVGPHGRITIDEIKQLRVDTLRKADSQMPMNRYAADYQPSEEQKVVSPYLDTLTKAWVEGLINGEELLPTVDESLKVHQLLFDWIALAKSHQEVFPIT